MRLPSLCSALALIVSSSALEAAAPLPYAGLSTDYSYVELADMAFAAPQVVAAQIADAIPVKGAAAANVAAGKTRYYVQADVKALISGSGAPARVSYLIDLPDDSRGKRLKLKGEAVGDTAGAARMLAERPDPTRAAIAPALAAEIYGLEILARDIEDEHHNTTRFLVMTAEKAPASPPFTSPCVTSFVFRVRNLPAALYKALGGFATNGVNMTKLESYMENGAFTATFFYSEVDGRPEDRGLALAFEELGFFSEKFEILGVYPADPFRTRT